MELLFAKAFCVLKSFRDVLLDKLDLSVPPKQINRGNSWNVSNHCQAEIYLERTKPGAVINAILYARNALSHTPNPLRYCGI